jgi:xanthine dehydrogenase accessory factor
VREIALAVARSGEPQLRTYCSADGEGSVWDLGLGCGGEVQIFIEPALEPRVVERSLLSARVPFVVCTVVAGVGALAGRRLIVTPATQEGSLGNAARDAQITVRARALFGEGGTTIVSCGGCDVFLELLSPPPRLVICGAGDDAHPLARLGAEMGFDVLLADWRSNSLLDSVRLDPSCYVIVMTHNFAHDRELVRAALRSPVPYVGILGSRRRTEQLLAELGDDSTGSERVHSPVGLDLGGEGPEQVALSIIAEVLADHAGRRPLPLREREGPIWPESVSYDHVTTAGAPTAAPAFSPPASSASPATAEGTGTPRLPAASR